MPATAVQAPTVTDRLAELSKAHQQTRHVTLPPLVGGGVVVCGALLHYLPMWAAVLVWIGAGVLVVTGYDHAARIARVWERLWALGCVTALWVAGAYWTVVGPTWGPRDGLALFVCAAVGVPLAVPWSLHRRVRLGVQVSQRILAFVHDIDAVGWKGVTVPLSSVKVTDPDHWEATLEPVRDGEWTLEKLQAMLPRVAARLGVSASKVQVVAAKRRRGLPFRARLLVDESEKANAPTKWAPPKSPTDIRDAYRKGELAGGGTFWSRWWSSGYGAVSGASAGALGSGKTVNAESDAAALATAHNALDPWIYDGKPNSPNWAPWGPRNDGLPALTDWYTTRAETFRLMVIACWAIAETRSASKHDPTPTAPFVGIIADECAIVFTPNTMEVEVQQGKSRRDAERVAESIRSATRQYLQIHRSTATALRMLTVRANMESFGDATIRSYLQSGEVSVFRVSNPRDAQFLFSGHGDPPIHTLPRNEPGNAYFLNVDHPEPVRARNDWFDDDEVTAKHSDNAIEALRRWKAEHPESSPTLPPEALAAIRARVGSAYDRRWDEHAARGAGAASMWPTCEADGCSAENTGADLMVGACLECGHSLSEFQAQVVGSIAEEKAAEDAEADRAAALLGDQHADDEPATEEVGPTVAPAPARYRSRSHARQHCLDALRSLGDGWHSSSDVRAVLGDHKSPDIVRTRLAELVDLGAVEKAGRRDSTTYRALREVAEPPEQDPDSTGTAPEQAEDPPEEGSGDER